MKMLRKLCFFMVLVLSISSLAFGTTIKVPEEYTEIQEAIDASEHGDIILVAPGIYNGPIDFISKSITVRSDVDGDPATYDISPRMTIIEGGKQVVSFRSGETNEAVIDGFTIRNGDPGVSVMNLSDATIKNCIVTLNSAWGGGGSSVWFQASATFMNCIFCRNDAVGGGGLDVGDSSSVTMINCTFSGNYAETGGALYVTMSSSATLINCIFWGNIADEGHEIAIDGNSSATVKYCVVQAGQLEVFVDETSRLNWESGNIDTDPLFTELGYWMDVNDPNIAIGSDDPNAVWIDGDYHLKSQAGRYDPDSASWVIDDVTSPCIDAGDPNSSIGDEPVPNGGIINMGAFGATQQASKSLAVAVRVDEDDADSQVALELGQILIVTLESNPTTGYQWEVIEDQNSILEQIGETEFKSSDEGGPPMVGAGGWEIFRFRAVSSGQMNLQLIYRRSWEIDVEPINTFSIDIVVN